MRGKIPRSFKFPDGSSLNQTAAATDSYIYDTALAIIATTGAEWYDLANEIVTGVLNARNSDGSFPFIAGFDNATARSTFRYNKSIALLAYALGFYLEAHPSPTNTVGTVDAMRDMLNFISTQRNLVYRNGLVKFGIDGTGDYDTYTDDNILSFYAYKQSGKITGDANFINIAEQLVPQIYTFYQSGTLYSGRYSNGNYLTTDDLNTLALGAIFYVEKGDLSTANVLLSRIETLATIDTVIGVKGYSKTSSTLGQVWFEGTYMAAIAYYRIGNSNKYKQIVKEISKYIDSTDGGQIGALKKDSWGANFINYKAVGATAWAYIAKNQKAVVFKIRENVTPISGLTPIFWNQRQSNLFTKNDCTISPYRSPAIEFAIEAGFYFSYIDVNDANSKALTQVYNEGQARANIIGQCIQQYGNEYRSKVFYSQNCQSGYVPVAYKFEVSANTYYADTVLQANALRDQNIDANGQNDANVYGQCTINQVGNEYRSSTFYSQNCGTNMAPDPYLYEVFPNTYFASDQLAANNLADQDIANNGQNTANTSGSCRPYVGNDQREGTFYSQNCSQYQTANAYVYYVYANTYFAADKLTANQMAMNDVNANGQNNANTYGGCTDLPTYLNVTTTFDTDGGGWTNYYVTINASRPLTDNIYVSVDLIDDNGNKNSSVNVFMSINQTASASTYIGQIGPDSFRTYNGQIQNVMPNPDLTGMQYLW